MLSQEKYAIPIVVLVLGLFSLVFLKAYNRPVKVGDCYLLNRGAWEDKLVIITKVGDYGALAKDLDKSTYRINKRSHSHERVDCFDSF